MPQQVSDSDLSASSEKERAEQLGSQQKKSNESRDDKIDIAQGVKSPKRSDLVVNRMKWLQDQGKAEEDPTKKPISEEINSGSVEEDSTIRQQVSDSDLGVRESEELLDSCAPVRSELYAEKTNLLSEVGKEATIAPKVTGTLIANDSIAEKTKCLSEVGKAPSSKPNSTAEVACELIVEKANFLEENNGNEILQSSLPSKEETGPESVHGSVSERMKWLNSKVSTYQSKVTRESDVISASAGKMKFIADIAMNNPGAPAKFKSVPHQVRIDNVAVMVSDGLIPAVKSNFENGEPFVVVSLYYF